MLQNDTQREFKSLVVTNALDGSEGYLILDKLSAVVRDKMVKKREELITSQPGKTLKEVILNLIQPKRVKRRGNVEGIELLDCEDEELLLEEFEQESNDEVCNDEEVVKENGKAEKNPEQSGTIATLSTSKTSTSNAYISLSNFTNDLDIKRDTEF